MTTRFVLFDLGGVLVENVGFARLDASLPTPIGLDAVKARWLAAPCVRRFELGLIAPEVFARELVAEWPLPCTADAFLDDFANWLPGFYPGALDLLDALRRTHRIGCLSNSNAVHWARFDGFAALFDVTLSSHLSGLIKPDAACFAQAIAACGVAAADILFIDDAQPNVDAARRAGIDAERADGTTGTLAVLRSRALLP